MFVKVVYTGIDQPNGLVMELTEDKARAVLRSPSYRLHDSVEASLAERVLPPPLTLDERFDYLMRRYLSTCKCLNKKEERDALRAELHAIRVERRRLESVSIPA
jgi:hypothetical protein